MKQFSKIALPALGFGLLIMVFLSVHGPTVKAQSATGAKNNTQIALVCIGSLTSSPCKSWWNVNTQSQFTAIPTGQTLVITDMECYLAGETPGGYGICWLGNSSTITTNVAAIAGAISGPAGQSVMGLHLTTGIQYTTVPNVNFNGKQGAGGSGVSLFLQGYLIPTPSSGGS